MTILEFKCRNSSELPIITKQIEIDTSDTVTQIKKQANIDSMVFIPLPPLVQKSFKWKNRKASRFDPTYHKIILLLLNISNKNPSRFF